MAWHSRDLPASRERVGVRPRKGLAVLFKKMSRRWQRGRFHRHSHLPGRVENRDLRTRGLCPSVATVRLGGSPPSCPSSPQAPPLPEVSPGWPS